MTHKNIIKKIDEAGLVGRGGAAYPTAHKWATVKAALKGNKAAYIVVNGSEGEPGVKKDSFLLENETEEIINGVYLAYEFLGSAHVKKIYFFLKHEYHKNCFKKIKEILEKKKYKTFGKKVEIVIKPESPSYICGEETAILNIIEGHRSEPRIKPPFPSTYGLHGQPTLVNNVETFYAVSLIAKDKYEGKRFYTLGGEVKHRGVFALAAEMSAEEILRATGNYPNFDFFVMIGGEVCGDLLRSDQLQAPVEGSGLLMVFDKKKTDQKKLLDYWLKFYEAESCGLCTACREGTYRLRELASKPEYDKELFNDLIHNLEESSLCSLGSSLSMTIKSKHENIN
ncbi:MAG: NADH-ubiquinone oxidoreductase-F iron-sulfur binding region domain-containing protein [Patescibacteria group bacterium]